MLGLMLMPALPMIAVGQVGTITSGVPDTVDPQADYLLYLHGRIIETQGRRPTHPTFGVYEYDAILEDFARRGFQVLSEARPADTRTADYAEKVAAQVRRLVEAGVAPEHITVAGFSKGGMITIATSSVLRLAANRHRRPPRSVLPAPGSLARAHVRLDRRGGGRRPAGFHRQRLRGIVKYASSILDLIGNTPLLALDRINEAGAATLLGKCEFFNPVAIKDRPALWMIREAEKRGDIGPGTTLVEATSGNTGMALAYIGRMRGYRVVLCMSEIQSVERRRVLQALGAELVLTPAELGTKGAKAKALEIHESTPGSFYVCQHDNMDNRLAHIATTSEEIWADTDGRVDIFVAPLGTGGTLCGVAEALKPRKPALRTVGVEPREAPFVSEGRFAPHRMMGTAPGFMPGVLDRDLIDEICLVSEEEAFEMCRKLARTEGILVGISSGAAVHAALDLARQPENEGKVIVCMLCDSGERYLSVEGLFDSQAD